jgi:HD-like signal output (HDOD) protein
VASDAPLPLKADALKDHLLSTFRSPKYKPPVLPVVATELMALTRRKDVGLPEVTRTLERDPNLAAAVLRLARSPMYATRVAPTSLDQAVQRLGLVTVRDMVLQVVMDLRVFRAEGYKELVERVRRHSIVTGHLMRLIGEHAAVPADHAFLCGLLHDVGLGGVLIALGDLPVAQRPTLMAMSTALAGMHHEASAMMARLWDLPPEVVMVLQRHHDFDATRMRPICPSIRRPGLRSNTFQKRTLPSLAEAKTCPLAEKVTLMTGLL